MCRAVLARQPGPEKAQRRGDGHLGDNRPCQRSTDCERYSIHEGHHDCFFLSLRTRSISLLSASSSSSVQDASDTRAVINCRSEPPKNVCTYCRSAVRLATAGETVAE